MPQTIKHTTTTRRTRTGSGKRGRKTQSGRKERPGEGKSVTRVIADSIFAITPQIIPGVIVDQALERRRRYTWDTQKDDYEKMYYDLFAAYKNYCRMLGNDAIEFDPLKSGIGLSKSLYLLTNRMKELVPKTWNFNIDRQGDNYCFTIFKELQFDHYWHYFNIEPVVKFLIKKNKALHDLFISALAILSSLDIQTWYSGSLYATSVLVDETSIMDWIECRVDDESEVDEMMAKMSALRRSYSTGEVADYQRLIEKSRLKPDALKSRITELGFRNPIKSWILQVVNLAKRTYRLRDFIYEPDYDGDTEGALRLEDQITILWSEKDCVFEIACEYMDNDVANFGVEAPVYHFSIDKNTKVLPFEKMDGAQDWLNEITGLYNSYQDVLRYVKYE